jgi:hypothetical protein
LENGWLYSEHWTEERANDPRRGANKEDELSLNEEESEGSDGRLYRSKSPSSGDEEELLEREGLVFNKETLKLT